MKEGRKQTMDGNHGRKDANEGFSIKGKKDGWDTKERKEGR